MDVEKVGGGGGVNCEEAEAGPEWADVDGSFPFFVYQEPCAEAFGGLLMDVGQHMSACIVEFLSLGSEVSGDPCAGVEDIWFMGFRFIHIDFGFLKEAEVDSVLLTPGGK